MLEIVSQENFFGHVPHGSTAKQHLCEYTPWMDVQCLLRLCKLYQPETYLEVGCHRGGTMYVLSDRFRNMRCTGVDPGDLVAEDERHGVQRREYLPATQIGKLCPPATIHRRCFADADLTGPFDLIFIDGDHRANAVRHDVAKALTLLPPGGVIACHDVGNPVVPDVEIVLKELPIKFQLVEDTWIAYHVSPR